MKEWREYPDECPDCGSDVEIFTHETEHGYCRDGDEVQCRDEVCGFSSIMSVDEDGSAWIQ